MVIQHHNGWICGSHKSHWLVHHCFTTICECDSQIVLGHPTPPWFLCDMWQSQFTLAGPPLPLVTICACDDHVVLGYQAIPHLCYMWQSLVTLDGPPLPLVTIICACDGHMFLGPWSTSSTTMFVWMWWSQVTLAGPPLLLVIICRNLYYSHTKDVLPWPF